MFRLKCLPGVLIGEHSTAIQHQTKPILKIKAGKKNDDELNLCVKIWKCFMTTEKTFANQVDIFRYLMLIILLFYFQVYVIKTKTKISSENFKIP